MIGTESLELSAITLQALRDMYDDPEGRFRSEEQAEAVQLALQGDRDLLTILPTGGGKSLVFMLPAWLEKERTTVVIVPFVALVEQMEERCIEMGLSCHVWRKLEAIINIKSQIVLVAVEHAIMPEFQHFLMQLENAERLSRIVIDECHTSLTQRGFRSVMRRLGSVVRCVCVQLILLTATLPIEMEERLRIIMGCEHWKIVRKEGDRPELKYRVEDVSERVNSREELNREIERLLRSKIEDFEDNDRAIIYCLQRDWTKELADFLNKDFGEEICGIYHAKMERKERKEIFDRWKRGDLLFIATTNALRAGIDHSGVRLVIHQGHGKNMIDFCQETGRGGRDGKMAEAVTLFWSGIVQESDWIEEEERAEVLRWIEGKECRRLMIGRYLDGEGRNCMSLSKGEICDVCEKSMERAMIEERGQMSVRIIGKRRGVKLAMNAAREGADLKEMIRELRGRCMMCWMNGKQGIREHEYQRCRYVSRMSCD